MRLTAQELDIIRSEILAADPNAKIFLFGSRVDDTRRGGDIDLFVETSYRLDLRRRFLVEHQISSACDTKVDLIFKAPDDEETPIHRIAKTTGICLNEGEAKNHIVSQKQRRYILMRENLKIILRHLDILSKRKAGLAFSLGRVSAPLAKIDPSDMESLSLEENDVIQAFTLKFIVYRDQLGALMRNIAIEEESETTPFCAVLALMEKLGILDSAETWKDVRDLRNRAAEYEEDPVKAFHTLNGLMSSAPFLFRVHEKMESFVRQNYMPKDENNSKLSLSDAARPAPQRDATACSLSGQ